MKTPSLLLCVAAFASVANAANCTDEEVSTIASMPEVTKLETTCAGLSSATTSSTTDLATLCSSTCVSSLEAAIKALPSCSIGGTSVSGGYSAVVTACKAATGSKTTNSGSSLALGMAFAAVSVFVGLFLATA